MLVRMQRLSSRVRVLLAVSLLAATLDPQAANSQLATTSTWSTLNTPLTGRAFLAAAKGPDGKICANDPAGYYFIGGDPVMLIESHVDPTAPITRPDLECAG